MCIKRRLRWQRCFSFVCGHSHFTTTSSQPTILSHKTAKQQVDLTLTRRWRHTSWRWRYLLRCCWWWWRQSWWSRHVATGATGSTGTEAFGRFYRLVSSYSCTDLPAVFIYRKPHFASNIYFSVVGTGDDKQIKIRYSRWFSSILCGSIMLCS